jgi:hypothetical protein
MTGVRRRPKDGDVDVCALITGATARSWRPGRGFGRRLTRLSPSAPGPAPLYSLGTAARIERLRSWSRDGWLGQQDQMTDATLIAISQRLLPTSGGSAAASGPDRSAGTGSRHHPDGESLSVRATSRDTRQTRRREGHCAWNAVI